MVPETRRDFAGEFVHGGERIPATVTFALSLRDLEPGEGPESLEAELGLSIRAERLDVLREGTVATRKMLTTYASGMEAIASGGREQAFMGVDPGFEIYFSPLPARDDYVLVTGDFMLLTGVFPVGAVDTAVHPRWAKFIEVSIPKSSVVSRMQGRQDVTLSGLQLPRSEVGALAAFLREFLERVGDALPEVSEFDNSW